MKSETVLMSEPSFIQQRIKLYNPSAANTKKWGSSQTAVASLNYDTPFICQL